MAKDLNLAAILKRRPLRAWDAAQLMMRHLIEERGPTRQGFLKPEEVQAIKDGLAGAEIPIYNRFMTLYEELDHNLLRGLGVISTFQVMTLQLEQLLDQFRTAADLTEDLGTELDELGEAGDKLKRTLGYSLFWVAPLAISWPAIGKDKAEWAASDKARFGGFFETARNADITAFADRFKQDNPYRVMTWQNVLAYGDIFKLAESVLGIDYWTSTFESVWTGTLKDKARFEAKATYLDCLLRHAVKRNTDPMLNPAALRLGAATLAAMSEEDRAALVGFYPDLETELQEIDEDIALGELLGEDGNPKDPDRVAELLAGRIEARRQAIADSKTQWRAKLQSAGTNEFTEAAANDLDKFLDEKPIPCGYFATIDLTEIANWPEGETPKDRALAWLDAEEAERTLPLSRQDPALVARWQAKREELRPTVSAEVLGPKAYDGFLQDSILTDLKPMVGGGLDPQAYTEFMQHLESFRQYAPAS